MLVSVSLLLALASPDSSRETEPRSEASYPIYECPSGGEAGRDAQGESDEASGDDEDAEKPPTKTENEPGPEPWSRLQLAPVLLGSTVLGIGPPTRADRFAALGGATGLHIRMPKGAFFGAELRAVGRGDASGTSLVRLRSALGVGYWLRYRSLSLGLSMWATVEPWWLRGSPAKARPNPMWGLAARIEPALYEDRVGNRNIVLMLGPVVELSASASFGDQGAEVILVRVENRGNIVDRMRVGGVEVSTGFMGRIWFDLPPRSRATAGGRR